MMTVVTRELEVFGGVRGESSCCEEELFSPAAHARRVASVQVDRREEVRNVSVVAERACWQRTERAVHADAWSRTCS
jgi:hypothetical protein